ncbi:hypothetical protein ACK87B_002637, partial [Salmonella enterica]
GGAFLCLPFDEYLRQTVSSTRSYSNANIRTASVNVFLKYFCQSIEITASMSYRIISESTSTLYVIKKPAREQVFIYLTERLLQ